MHLRNISVRSWTVWLGVGLILAVGWWWLHQPYGETTPRGYAYATAMFAACNQRDRSRLEEISSMIRKDVQAGILQRQEAEWLEQIIEWGRAEKWERANREIRKLMLRQASPVDSDAVPAPPHEH
ncbi:MAG: hypothetical protein D6753_13065 [Planctomycetota bacterium]|nr:MAG: hypothetical protein D6753_13065 [Planctomycetota bacterium]